MCWCAWLMDALLRLAANMGCWTRRRQPPQEAEPSFTTPLSRLICRSSARSPLGMVLDGDKPGLAEAVLEVVLLGAVDARDAQVQPACARACGRRRRRGWLKALH